MSDFFYEFNDKKLLKVELKEASSAIEGKGLDSLLTGEKKLSQEEIYFIIDQLLSILAEMRSVFPPIVHKNINPSVIIVKEGLELALIGFDLETPKSLDGIYMAPEVLETPTPKSDLYSVGKVLFNLSENNNFDEAVNRFIEVMIQENSNDRFRDIKTAEALFEKIKNNTFTDKDWDFSFKYFEEIAKVEVEAEDYSDIGADIYSRGEVNELPDDEVNENDSYEDKISNQKPKLNNYNSKEMDRSVAQQRTIIMGGIIFVALIMVYYLFGDLLKI